MPRATPDEPEDPSNQKPTNDPGYGEPMAGRLCPFFHVKCKGDRCALWHGMPNHVEAGVCLIYEIAQSTTQMNVRAKKAAKEE